MRRVVTGWLIIAGCMALLGIGAMVGAGAPRSTDVTEAMMQEWRRYAAEVERGARSPSPVLTRLLTETAIAQHEYARAAGRALRFVGAGITILSLLLVADLARHRGRNPSGPPSEE